MLSHKDILQTRDMIDKRHLDIRTITMGISLLDCMDTDVHVCARKIYDKITKRAENLVKVGQDIEWEFGIPIVNKRISVTPISLVGGSVCKTSEDFVQIAKALDQAANTCGVNFIGGYSALVSKGMTKADTHCYCSYIKIHILNHFISFYYFIYTNHIFSLSMYKIITVCASYQKFLRAVP